MLWLGEVLSVCSILAMYLKSIQQDDPSLVREVELLVYSCTTMKLQIIMTESLGVLALLKLLILSDDTLSPRI